MGGNAGSVSCILGTKECSLSVEVQPAPGGTLIWVPAHRAVVLSTEKLFGSGGRAC